VEFLNRQRRTCTMTSHPHPLHLLVIPLQSLQTKYHTYLTPHTQTHSLHLQAHILDQSPLTTYTPGSSAPASPLASLRCPASPHLQPLRRLRRSGRALIVSAYVAAHTVTMDRHRPSGVEGPSLCVRAYSAWDGWISLGGGGGGS